MKKNLIIEKEINEIISIVIQITYKDGYSESRFTGKWSRRKVWTAIRKFINL